MQEHPAIRDKVLESMRRLARATAQAHQAGWQAMMRMVRHRSSPHIRLQIAKDKVPKLPRSSPRAASLAALNDDLGSFIDIVFSYSAYGKEKMCLPSDMFVCPSNLKSGVEYCLPPISIDDIVGPYEWAVKMLLEGHLVQLQARLEQGRGIIDPIGYCNLNTGGRGTVRLTIERPSISPQCNIAVDVVVNGVTYSDTIDINIHSASFAHLEQYAERVGYMLWPGREPPTIPLKERFEWGRAVERSESGRAVARRNFCIESLQPVGLYWTTDGLVMTSDERPGAKVVFVAANKRRFIYRDDLIATDGNHYWEVSGHYKNRGVLVVRPPSIELAPDDLKIFRALIKAVWAPMVESAGVGDA